MAGHGEGESRFVESAAVTEKLQSTLGLFDLIVGTEEEFHIAGGSIDTMAALRAVRAVSDATLVCKRGALGAVAFEGAVESWDSGTWGEGFPIEVFNVLGAGDGFMSGLLRGWLGGEDWSTSLTWANACGAFAVSRHGCTPAYPSWEELRFFIDRGVVRPDLRNDAQLEQVHWATTRHARTDGDWWTCASSPSTTARSSRKWRARRPRRSGLQDALPEAASARGGRARRATASCATTGWDARRCTRPPAPACGSGVQRSCPARAPWLWRTNSAPTAGASPSGRATRS